MTLKKFISDIAVHKVLEKRAAMIDSVQDRMLPDIWTSDEKLIPELRDRILKLLYSKVPRERVGNVLLMGGATSYQYNPQTDLDINVTVKDATEEEMGSNSSSLVRDISHIPIWPDGKRTMQYYVREWQPRELNSYRRASTAIYNVLDDEWLVRPRRPHELRDPEDQFHTEFILADHYKRKFGFHAERYKYWKTRSKEKAQKHLYALYELTNKIYMKRRKGYDLQWGVGRDDWRNVIFKVLEYSEHGDLFQKLMQKDKELPDDYTKLELI